MEESRKKVVLILGNGFDLDLGLKTTYKDFWESDDCPKDYPAPLIRHLNDVWGDNLESVRWYDLENQLYEYALHGDKTDVVSEAERNYVIKYSDYEIVNDINYINGGRDEVTSLIMKGYMKLKEKMPVIVSVPYRDDFSLSVLERDKRAFRKIQSGLCQFISKVDIPVKNNNTLANRVILSVEKAAEDKHLVDIYSFNYTHVRSNGCLVQEVLLHYIHGCCENNNIIIGTRDSLEIPDEYVFLMKPFDHKYYPTPLVEDLAAADEIIIFGHSLGENDQQYFKAFFKRQVSHEGARRRTITIITRDEDSEIEIKRALLKMTDGNVSSLFSQNEIRILHTKRLKEDNKRLLKFLSDYYEDELSVSRMIGELVKPRKV